jgi:site-specific DNA-methyltransferase (adenine-specific)
VSAAADSGGGVSAADSGGGPGALVELPAVLPPAPRTFGDGAIELRVGRWQEALADVASVDVLITDPPYSERTHAGMLVGTKFVNPNHGRNPYSRSGVAFTHWTASDVTAFVEHWTPRVRGWIVIVTDDVLAPVFQSTLERCDRYAFAPLPFVEVGKQPRLSGDGPASWTCWIVVARPSCKPYSAWGSLPGAYVPERSNYYGKREIKGGKPLWLMQALVRDYSRPGDLICDPCAGGATTLLAAAIEGRRAIGAEMDPATYALACKRLGRGYTPSMFSDAERTRTERAPATQHDLDLGITTTR